MTQSGAVCADSALLWADDHDDGVDGINPTDGYDQIIITIKIETIMRGKKKNKHVTYPMNILVFFPFLQFPRPTMGPRD